MFEVLSASAAARRLDPGRALLAAVLHGVILVGAVRATVAHGFPAPPRQFPLIQFVPSPPVVEPVPTSPGTHEASIVARPRVELPSAPSEIPSGIPPILDGPVLDPAVLRRALSPGLAAPYGADSTPNAGAMAAAEVDERAAVIRQPRPRYPVVLQSAGIEGTVLLEFIIDSTGHPEPGSLRVVERSRPGFDAAALETIQGSLFRPARFRGRTVRQRTLQAIVFRVGRE